MKEYKGLKIPDLATKELMLKCIKGSHCMMPSDRCPGIDCGECLTSNQNKEYLREYLNEGGKDVSEEIDQEKLCEYCRDHYEENLSWHCEEITEMYLEDNPHIKLKENDMNKNISEVFDKTKDALFVEKHLGAEIGTTFIDGLILADKKTEVLAEAKRLEKEEKDNK